MRLQADLEFETNEIKQLNKKYHVEMFSTKVSGGQALNSFSSCRIKSCRIKN